MAHVCSCYIQICCPLFEISASCWHFNQGTTYMNVTRTTVRHLFCRMTNNNKNQKQMPSLDVEDRLETNGWMHGGDCIISHTNAVHKNKRKLSICATIPTNYKQAISRPYFTEAASARVKLHWTVTFLNVAWFAVTFLTVARRSLNIRLCQTSRHGI